MYMYYCSSGATLATVCESVFHNFCRKWLHLMSGSSRYGLLCKNLWEMWNFVKSGLRTVLKCAKWQKALIMTLQWSDMEVFICHLCLCYINYHLCQVWWNWLDRWFKSVKHNENFSLIVRSKFHGPDIPNTKSMLEDCWQAVYLLPWKLSEICNLFYMLHSMSHGFSQMACCMIGLQWPEREWLAAWLFLAWLCVSCRMELCKAGLYPEHLTPA